MIIGNSNDPVLIKKIGLKIWLLKDEVAAVTTKSIKNFEDKSVLRDKLKDEYLKKDGASGLKLVEKNETEETELTDSPSTKIVQRRSSIIPEDKIIKGVVVLSEIEMGRIHFFCNQTFPIGQTIVIEFQIPQLFSLTTEILYCHTFNMRNNIIAKNKYSFRVVSTPTFLKSGEKTLLRRFISSIEPEIKEVPKKADPEKKETESFDELDGLDL